MLHLLLENTTCIKIVQVTIFSFKDFLLDMSKMNLKNTSKINILHFDCPQLFALAAKPQEPTALSLTVRSAAG